MASEIRMNADGACLTLDEMALFTKQAKKYGCPGDTVVGIQTENDVVTFSLPVLLVHRALTGTAARPRRQRT